jgi:hypothetical protein
MASEQLPEPWHSFLSEIDRAATSPIAMHCIGGFAVSLYYGLARPTGDIDVVDVAPGSAKPWLTRTAGRGSALHKKHRVYLQIVTVAVLPYSYEDRVVPIFEDQFDHLRLMVLDPYDLTLSKLTRNLEVDLEDVKHLVQSGELDLDVLETRYREEVRPYVTGPVARHDLTLRLWLSAFREERVRKTRS